MSLDEFLFKKISNYYKNKSKYKNIDFAKACKFSDVKYKLEIYSKILSGRNITIIETEEINKYSSNQILFPSIISFFDNYELNHDIYLLRLYIVIQYIENKIIDKTNIVNRIKNESEKFSNLLYLIGEEELSKLEKLNEFLWNNNKLSIEILNDKNTSIENKDVIHNQKITTEIQTIKNQENVKLIEHNEEEDYNPVHHNFEKLSTADDYDNNWKETDGEDDLEQNQDALKDLKMNNVIRIDQEAHSIYKTNFVYNSIYAEVANVKDDNYSFIYPEWDYSKNVYKSNFCKIYIKNIAIKENNIVNNIISENKQLIDKLINKIKSIHDKRESKTFSEDFGNINIDKYLDFKIDLKNRRSQENKIFEIKYKDNIDLCVSILLDLSLSCDSYIEGKRILDLEIYFTTIIAEVFDKLGIRFSISGFNSKTRNNNNYYLIKTFNEKWIDARKKLNSVVPLSYTRIGPAMRHTYDVIHNENTKRKWILCFTDGKPNDYDTYEGKYGLNDVRKAINDSKNYNINTFGFAMEKNAKFYLAEIFGLDNYVIISQEKEFYIKIIKWINKLLI